MRKLNKRISPSFITVVFLALANLASAQSNGYIKRGAYASAETAVKQEKKSEDKLLYGPLPYRTLAETVGETYIVLPLMDLFLKDGYSNLFLKGASKNISAKEGEGKLLKLTSLNEKEGFFIDSSGTEYRCEIIRERFTELAPIYDILSTKKRLINKPLWLNIKKYVVGDPYADKGTVIENARFAKVMVIDVLASYSNNVPVFIIFKDDKGRVGYENANMSGTNSTIELPDLFIEKFFTENPQTKYKLSDKTWAAVKAGRTEIGMPMDAVQLIEGRPTKRNKSVIGNIRKEQWVYGETAIQSYFYFENGKLTGISR
ncbi:DUF2845 domain-containing protein [Mucilaginibacter sp. UR6-1]|uniref:DUF2845 domain-containing protein n=1 Tax=Mucilaginibacter sp. UR6-1 TaxID=1435643 RepID=UPI001E454F2C|nr:DUF2845 domain-containing protein [Mucilaginibacter sp. UR6-1]MCC8409788.1 DUF2845 domain-containing protein [Mucilaginibacter sp. UR6-1]